MASITIRKLSDKIKKELKVRASLNGRSMEEEARRILRNALSQEMDIETWLSTIREPFRGIEDFELDAPKRNSVKFNIDFSEDDYS